MEKQIAVLSGLLGEKGNIKPEYKPPVKSIHPRKELNPVSEADHKDLMANWKPVVVKEIPNSQKYKYIPLHRKPEVEIPHLISKSPFIERDIEMKE